MYIFTGPGIVLMVSIFALHLFPGNVNIWNHETQAIVKSFEVCDLPVRATRFVPRKNWVLTGSVSKVC